MALHACLIGNTVVEKVDIQDEQQYQALALQYSTIIDISALVVEPDIGWVLNGVVLEPGPGQEISTEQMIRSRIEYFQKEAPALLVDMYVQNTLYGITAEQSDQMFDNYQDVLIRIREGAWPTALYRLQQKQPSGFATQQMIDGWINLLVTKMTQV